MMSCMMLNLTGAVSSWELAGVKCSLLAHVKQSGKNAKDLEVTAVNHDVGADEDVFWWMIDEATVEEKKVECVSRLVGDGE